MDNPQAPTADDRDPTVLWNVHDSIYELHMSGDSLALLGIVGSWSLAVGLCFGVALLVTILNQGCPAPDHRSIRSLLPYRPVRRCQPELQSASVIATISDRKSPSVRCLTENMSISARLPSEVLHDVVLAFSPPFLLTQSATSPSQMTCGGRPLMLPTSSATYLTI